MGVTRWIGGIIGFMAGGPLGALAGYALGYLFDIDPTESSKGFYEDTTREKATV